MKRGLTLSVVVGGALATACGAEAPRPAAPASALDRTGSRPVPVVQRLRVVALADDAYRRLPNHEARIGDRVDASSDHLAALFGLPLDLRRVVPWTPSKAVFDLEGLLALVEEGEDPAPDADLILLFTAQPPPDAARMDDLVRSRYAGRMVVARSLTTLFEDGGGDALHRAEALALLHGIANVFGALPACGNHVMADRPAFRLADPEAGAAGWTDLNLALVRAHATLDLRTRKGHRRLPADVARKAAALLAPDAPGLPACAADAVMARRLLLETSAAPLGPVPPKPGEADLASGLAALAAGRTEEALRRCAAAAEADPSSEASRCAGLAAEKLGRSDDGERHLRAWLLHHEGDRDATLALARLVGRNGDDAAARAVLAAWVDAHADDADAWLNLGIAHARLGDVAAARRAWETVLQLRPDDADGKKLLRQLPR